MLKAKVNIQVLKVDRRLTTLFKPFFCEVKRFRAPKWAFSLKILVPIASYGPQIDQSHGDNRLSHIIIIYYKLICLLPSVYLCKRVVLVRPSILWCDPVQLHMWGSLPQLSRIHRHIVFCRLFRICYHSLRLENRWEVEAVFDTAKL